MTKNFAKEYNDLSNQFQKSKASKESIGKLYDLLHEMQSMERTKQEDQILVNIYRLLGFHQSAFDLFKSIVDTSDPKTASKLYVYEEKARSHGDNFTLKDTRKSSKKRGQVALTVSDFVASKSEDKKFALKVKEIVIFNKAVKGSKVEVYIYGDRAFEDCVGRIINYIGWLCDCRTELIDCYNAQISPYSGETADEEWFHSLEIFGVRLIVGQDGNLYAEISGGDSFSEDHILDIETENESVVSIQYDG